MERISELRAIINERIDKTQNIFLISHKLPDFDAIGSCIGMYKYLLKYKKPTYIIIGEPLSELASGVKMMMEDINTNTMFINIDTYNKIKTEDDLLIMCDVNKGHLIYNEDILNNFKNENIIVIDHHNQDNRTVNTKNKYIKPSISSTSEIVTEVLIQSKTRIDREVANYLLAGIYLDTNKFQKNCNSKTMSIISKLMKNGAELGIVDNYFAEDFLSDRKVQELIGKTGFYTYTLAIAIADPDIKYTKEELAKAADYLMKYKSDATFAAGYIDDDTISMSARSKGKILVGDIMHNLTPDGGGNSFSGAARMKDTNLEETEKKLLKLVVPPFYKIEKN